MQTVQIDTGDVALSCVIAGEGPLVLALHGFPDCWQTFRPVIRALAAAGYRVVAPALRGYAPSGLARSGRHHALGVADDILFLADHLSPGAPVRLVGHDWGAVACFAAAARSPERFSHLATMAVPHPAAFIRRGSLAQMKRSWYMGLFQLPVIAEARLSRDDFALIDRLWADWSPGYCAPPGQIAVVKEGIRDRVGPVLAYYRALRSPAVLREARPMFGPTRVPAIHIHGEDDGCIGVECAEGAERFYERGYRLHRVAGAGHFMTHEKPAEVSAILTEFFAQP